MTQQPFYPPQYPAYPQSPAQQPIPQQPYAPPAPQYAAPAYGGYPAPAPAVQAQPLAQGTLDDFYNQPSSGGGPSLKFEQIGTRYIGIVSRPLTAGDVQQQTNTQGVPLFFKDGRPKWVMKVPLQMQPSPAYPDGIGQWYVKGGARDELNRAMAEAGAPAGPPEQGAIIDVTFASTRNSGAGMNPAKVFHVVYTRPQGAGAATPPPAPEQQVPQAPVQPQFQQAAPAPAPQPVQQLVQPPQQAAVPQAPALQPAAAPAPALQPAAAPAPQGQLPPNFTPEQAELFARLAGPQAQQG